jgi:hypothetical protein
MGETQNRSLLVLDVVRGGRVDVRVAQHLLRCREPEAAVDLRAEFLSKGVQRRAAGNVDCHKSAFCLPPRGSPPLKARRPSAT